MFGKIHDLVKTLIAQFSNFAIGKSQPDTPLSAIPHGKEHRRWIRVVIITVDWAFFGRLQRNRFCILGSGCLDILEMNG